MKKALPAAVVAAGLILSCLALSYSQDAGGRISRTKQSVEVSKCNHPDEINVDVNVAFSGQYGQTVTDENGTYYNVFGYCFFENKVYPPEYWGVFPLYFFDTRVGVALSVRNKSAENRAKVRLRQECFCLRTDSSNGGELTDPVEDDLAVNEAETATFDASFCAYYTPYAESGLDRYLVKVYRPGALDGNNGSHSLDGQININPNNNAQHEFALTLPDGSIITRDVLLEGYPGYVGTATRVHVKPKGNGNQNGLIVDGQAWNVVNANTYDIMADSMNVNLYNDHVTSDGKAMGHWWISINGVGATILVGDDNNPPLLVKEAVFCPPAYDGEVADLAKSVLGN